MWYLQDAANHCNAAGPHVCDRCRARQVHHNLKLQATESDAPLTRRAMSAHLQQGGSCLQLVQ